jgi:phage terminase large subunit-like protein
VPDALDLEQYRRLVEDPATSDEDLTLFADAFEAELYDWDRWARDAQKPPPGDWLVWLILAGRGYGKTRTGAEYAKRGMLQVPNSRWALVAETYADGRDTMIEGESGLLSVLPPSALRAGTVDGAWNRSLGELYLANGSKAKIYSSEKPGQLRGPQHHGAWGDEPFKWRDANKGDTDDTTWANLTLGLRLGADPRVILTGTPKRCRLLLGTKERPGLLTQPSTVVVKGTSFENLANLAPTFRAQILSRYEGTRLGRQELYADVLDDVEGALWQLAVIDEHRVTNETLERIGSHLSQIVLAIDPAVTSGEDADETGIVGAGRTSSNWCPVCGSTSSAHGFVLGDWTVQASPDTWARAAVGAYDLIEGDRIVGEVNNGGELVALTIRTVDPHIPFEAVHASRGKRIRAEPVAALYEQGRIHHLGTFPELEDQLTTWTPDATDSPDRMDALVWALSSVMFAPERGKLRYGGSA